MEVKKCIKCANHLTGSCPFFIQGLNDYINDCVSENGRIEFGVDCWQSEEDKILCDLMCGGVEDD